MVYLGKSVAAILLIAIAYVGWQVAVYLATHSPQ
jgi:hypothetical protein